MTGYLEYYLYGVIIMAMLEAIQVGYEDRDIDGQLILNSLLWPLVLLSVLGRIIHVIKNI